MLTDLITQLAPIDLKALRNADQICFYQKVSPVDNSRVRGEGLIRCIKRVDNDPFVKESVYEIQVQSFIESYESREEGDCLDAFEMIHHADYSDEWQTIARFLKPGDVIYLKWMRGNNSEIIRSHGLSCDQMKVCVRRGEDGRRDNTFMLFSRCGQRNTARMTRNNAERGAF